MTEPQVAWPGSDLRSAQKRLLTSQSPLVSGHGLMQSSHEELPLPSGTQKHSTPSSTLQNAQMPCFLGALVQTAQCMQMCGETTVLCLHLGKLYART